MDEKVDEKSERNKKKVFVGMSGGVDSSVSAALLQEAGYDVTGVFIKVWQPEREFKCTWREDRLDAMHVAAKLSIRFLTLDLEDEYKRHVVDYMIAEYRAGRTPNPDVMCNKYVKFGGFFDWAMEQGADFVATGHYARIEMIKREKSKIKIKDKIKNNIIQHTTPRYDLLAGDDSNKDQSYFLWTLTQKQLAKTLFPVGNMEKPKVRELARRFHLPTAEKKDSQGLCFIGKIDLKEFLSHYIKPEVGDVLDLRGQRIGKHDGAFFFTIGERHGFTIDSAHKTPHDGPYYVTGKDVKANTITVSQKVFDKNRNENSKEENMPQETAVQKVHLTDVNWIRGEAPDVTTGLVSSKDSRKMYMARPRYRAPLSPIILKKIGTAKIDTAKTSTPSYVETATIVTADIEFIEPQYTLSPGQSLVIYDGENGEICLGGGVIS